MYYNDNNDDINSSLLLVTFNDSSTRSFEVYEGVTFFEGVHSLEIEKEADSWLMIPYTSIQSYVVKCMQEK